jgi:hypothetical protein
VDIPSELLELDDWFELLSSGSTDEEIAAELGLDVGVIAIGRAALIERERSLVARTPEEQYAEYRIRIEGVLRQMDRVARRAMNPTPSAPAAPGGPPGATPKVSLKTAGDLLIAKAKIIDQVVARGQELGILPKAAQLKNVRVSGGIMFGAMGTPELVAEVQRLKKEQKEFDRLDATPFAMLPMPDIYDNGSMVEDESAPAPVAAPKVVRRKH